MIKFTDKAKEKVKFFLENAQEKGHGTAYFCCLREIKKVSSITLVLIHTKMNMMMI